MYVPLPAYGPGGAALGGGLLGAAGRLLEPLDYPRRAAWNAVRRLGEGDFVGALPGLGGLAAGVATGGLGLPAAMGIGSLVGGGLQGLGEATGDERFDAPSVSDLTGSDNPLLNFLVAAPLDPLTYAGVGGGLKAGKNLEASAMARGPMYAHNDVDMFRNIAKSPKFQSLHPHEQKLAIDHMEHYLKDNNSLLKVMREVEPGSVFGGSGVESSAWIQPSGGVAVINRPSEITNWTLENMLGQPPYPLDKPPMPIPDLPEVIKPVRSVPIEGQAPVRVNIVPRVTTSREAAEAALNAGINEDRILGVLQNDRRSLANSIETQGFHPYDLHMNNFGYDRLGEPLVFDANAIAPLNPATGAPLPRQPYSPGPQPGPIKNALLDMLGADQAVQSRLQQTLRSLDAPPPGNYPRRFDVDPDALTPLPQPPSSSGLGDLVSTGPPGPVAMGQSLDPQSLANRIVFLKKAFVGDTGMMNEINQLRQELIGKVGDRMAAKLIYDVERWK